MDPWAVARRSGADYGLPVRLDILIAVVLTVTTQVELWTNDGVEDPFAVQVAAFALMTVPLAWRRRATLAATFVVSLGFTVQPGPAPRSSRSAWSSPRGGTRRTGRRATRSATC